MDKLNFKYERKRIKHDKIMPALCKDYQTEENSDRCKRSKLCKNATYGWKNEAFGNCYGGTKSSEREHREKKFNG